jgi:hypothetical protein
MYSGGHLYVRTKTPRDRQNEGQNMKHTNKENPQSPTENHRHQDEVAQRAYELYQARGGEPGHELEDWLNAEQEVNKESQVIRSIRD